MDDYRYVCMVTTSNQVKNIYWVVAVSSDAFMDGEAVAKHWKLLKNKKGRKHLKEPAQL